MRNLSALLVMLVCCTSVWGQSLQPAKRLIRNKASLTQAIKAVNMNVEATVSPSSALQVSQSNSPIPVGTRYTTDAITVTKIGEASNPFTTLNSVCPPLAVAPGVGTGGTVAFLYRQNIVQCDPLGQTATINNGILRYSFSTDGGASWNTGDELPCFGVGPITPIYENPIRFPMAQLYAPAGSTNPEDLRMVAIGSILSQLNGDWDGAAAVSVNNITSGFNIEQEDYLFQGSFRNVNGGLTQRIPGEFWYVSLESVSNDAPGDNGLGRLHIYSGILNEASGEVDWQLNSIIRPDHFVGNLSGANAVGPDYTTPNIAFSPDGQIGYVTFLGDLVTGNNGVYSPVFLRTEDGGNTWGNAIEFDLSQYTELADSLSTAVLDSVFSEMGDFERVDTVIINPIPTTGFSHDLVVDAEGNPHMLAVVGAGSNPFNDTATYSIFSSLPKITVDFTLDEFGDFNMLYLSRQATFRGDFPADAAEEEQISVDMHPQVSRNADGTKIFFTWTDTDTTGGLTEDNIAPNMFTRALDLDTDLLTTTISWTEDDPTFGGQILLPKIPEIILEDSGTFTLPTVFTNLDGATALDPASFFYISDIVIPSTTVFSEPKDFFYNCKSNPFANQATPSLPNCGVDDGSIEIVAAGGLGEYAYQWDANADSATTPTISNLSTGIYSVIVSDVANCTDTIEVVLNNVDSPVLTLDSASTNDISCFGFGDGQIAVSATGGVPGYQFSVDGTNFVAESSFSELVEGIYNVVVRDTNNCESVIQVTIDEPDSISLNLTATDIRCNGEGNGSLIAGVFGGTGTFAFSWSTGDDTPELINLEADNYSVTVTDENGCTAQADASIIEPALLTASVNASAPNSSENPPFTGVAVAQAGGGTPSVGSTPYEFLWSDGSTQSFNTGLCGDTYSVTVTDENGCTATDSAVVGGIECETVTSLEDELAAGIFSWEIFPNPSVGQFTMVLELDRPQRITINLSDIQGRSILNERTNASSTFRRDVPLGNLAAGVYMLQVSTENGRATRRIMVK